MEKIYLWEENYDDYVKDENVIGSGIESTVYRVDEFDQVLKVLVHGYRGFSSIRRIKALSELDDLKDICTIPSALVYLDMNFIGYFMENAGISLREYILENNVSIQKRIELLKKIRTNLGILHDSGVIHGDLQPKNILINGDNVKIGDMNSVSFPKHRNGLLNEMTLYLAKYYGNNKAIDIQSFNYMCDCLLNIGNSGDSYYVYAGAEAYDRYVYANINNKYFDDDIYEEQRYIITNPKKVKKKALENSKYLIDYLK